MVVVEIGVVNELDGDVLMIAAKGHGLLIARPGGEQFIGADEALAVGVIADKTTDGTGLSARGTGQQQTQQSRHQGEPLQSN